MNKWVIIKEPEWSPVPKVKSVQSEVWENRMCDKDGEQYITGNGKLVFHKMVKSTAKWSALYICESFNLEKGHNEDQGHTPCLAVQSTGQSTAVYKF